MTTRLHKTLAALGAALLVAACGGGGSDTTTKVQFNSLVTFGDSLSDVGNPKVGTIAALSATAGGGRWTVSSAAGGEIWVERLAKSYNLPAPCAAETGLYPNIPGLVGAAATAHTECRNYAEGSARVSDPAGPNSVALQNPAYGSQVTLGLIAKPVNSQMAAHLAVVGSYSGKELVTVLAGANDLFMQLAFLGTPAGASTPAGAVTNMGTAGAALGALIKSQVVAKGAKYVLVLNVPDVAGTPSIKAMPAATQQLVDQMVQAFNGQLAASLSGVAEVHLGDIYSASKDQNANPAAYGLTNVKDVACGPNALSSPATAPGTALICNGTNTVAGDVSRYAYADNVHPTPYGHQLISQFVAKELALAGWL